MALRRHMLIVAAPMLAAGCGFALRRTPELPFRRIALVGFPPRSPLGEELHRALATGVEVIEQPARADVVFEALDAARQRVVVSSTAAGQVRELQLRVRLLFRLSTPKGRSLIAPTELLQQRDMNYNEALALAKEQEEAELFRAMQGDIVSQVMRRLAAVDL
jgi:LPS-assembly lipoprotein